VLPGGIHISGMKRREHVIEAEFEIVVELQGCTLAGRG
jgi:hypothetical protein